MENQIVNEVQTQVVPAQVIVPVRVLKCKPGLSKFNRLINKAQSSLSEQGHSADRFKRDYDTGVATYTCVHCSATAQVKVGKGYGENVVWGEALNSKCVR